MAELRPLPLLAFATGAGLLAFAVYSRRTLRVAVSPTGGRTLLTIVPGSRLTSPFGTRMHPVYNEPRMHKGVDLGAPVGSPVYSPVEGTVYRLDVDGVGRGASNGNAVHVRARDGRLWSFLHLSRHLVAPGDEIELGEALGLVGSTGVSTGPHLHLQVAEADGTVIDPATILT